MKDAAGFTGAVLALLLTAAPILGAAPAAPPTSNTTRWVNGGIAVDLAVEPLSSSTTPGPLHAGETVRIRFTLTDATAAPLTALSPGAWVDPAQNPGTPTSESACTSRIATFVGGGTLSDPALNLNSYVVVTMNDDASLSVLDPVGGFGGSRLLTMIPLTATAEDWVLNSDQTRLYVALRPNGEVAVIDTASWTQTGVFHIGRSPYHLALEPGGRRLWVLEPVGFGGVTAVDLATSEAAEVPVGLGPHRLAFSGDGAKAYVTNTGDSTVSIIDARTLHEIRRLPTGRSPDAVAVSALARAAYVVSSGDGTVTVIDTEHDTVSATLKAEPGLGEIRFAPGGRFGFLLNPQRDLIHVIDAAAQRIVQTGKVDSEPFQVVFSDTIAYIRHRKSADILMVPLGKIGGEGEPLPVGDFPGGRTAVGPSWFGPADSLVQVPGMSAMLVANPADRTVYFYKEGMAAPMGELESRPRAPRAVLAVDRSLRERSPGVYETTAILPSAGLFDLAFFLPAPRLVHCFPLRVEPKPGTAPPSSARQVAIEPIFEGHLTAGIPATLRARLTDRATGQPITGTADVTVTIVATGTNWSFHQAVTAKDDGMYEVPFQVPAAGVYYVYFTSPSLGLSVKGKPTLVLAAAKGGASPGGS